jgi:phage terminase small subunit
MAPRRNPSKALDLAAPPAHLSAEAVALWRRLVADFDMGDGAALALLRAACESFDRAQGARLLIEREGAVVRDRWQQAKPHPACQIETYARGQLIAALRAMRLPPGAAGFSDD